MNLAVELRALCKSFKGVPANQDLYLRVEAGTIHALIGENGAGKSTAMKMLFGILKPDSGEILIDGERRRWKSPQDAVRAGLGMVHQHFMLAEPYSVLENILLGIPGAHALKPYDLVGARAKLSELCKQFGFDIDLDARIEDLPVGIQQRIEILKLLFRDSRILIFDEPTAVLTPQETQELFANLKKLKAQGRTILIITHKLKEVMSLADRATVLRAGRVVGEREIAKTSMEDLASLMVGRKVTLTAAVPPKVELKAPVLEMARLSLRLPKVERALLSDISLTLHGGEVVGIAGVEGNGQSELLHVLLDPARQSYEGTLRILGKPAEKLDAGQVKALGVGVIPEDRHRQGLLLDRPVVENFLLGLQREKRFSQKGWLRRSSIMPALRRALDEYDVRPRDPEILIRSLSGGNQQKLIIAREFERRPKFLVAAQPTRGVDVGAIEMIHERILDARNFGVGVLLVSSELDEILALSDRILVMYGGRFVAEYSRGQASEQELGLKMGGASSV